MSKTVQCRLCDSREPLVWRRVEGKWRLFHRDREGAADPLRPHLCGTSGSDRAFKD